MRYSLLKQLILKLLCNIRQKPYHWFTNQHSRLKNHCCRHWRPEAILFVCSQQHPSSLTSNTGIWGNGWDITSHHFLQHGVSQEDAFAIHVCQSLSVLYFHMLRSLCGDLSLLAVSPTWESLIFVSSQVVCYDEQRPSLVVRAPGLFQTFVCVFLDNPEENFISSLLGGVYYPGLTLGVQLKPKPVPLGLWVARMGSVMPLPSGPRPIPGLQPMVCSMRFPMLVSGIGGAFSPTTPENKVHWLKKANNFCLRILTHTMLNTTYKCQL